MNNEEKDLIEKEESNKEVTFFIPSELVNSIFSVVALILFAMIKVIVHFGAWSPALNGIMAILIYSLAIFGVLWTMVRQKKVTVEFVFNGVVAFLVLLGF